LKHVLACTLVLLALATLSFGQTRTMRGSEICSAKRRHGTVRPILKGTDNTGQHTFDVLSYKLALDISACFKDPYPFSFSADEVITVLADSTLDTLTLNAISSSLAIDSVSLAGTSFSQSPSMVTIALDRAYNPGDTIRVGIRYRHLDVFDNAFYVGNGMLFTDCEPEGARSWFPCWDKPSDKATLDLTAIVAPGVLLGSNGRLADSTLNGNGLVYHWVSRDPIATYLMVISSKVGYNLDIVEWPSLSDSANKVPIRFYWNTGEDETNLHHVEDVIVPMMTQYSLLFGEYPFEKNGFATLNGQFIWSGMENQTLTSLCPDCWYEGLVSHEFAHQWFGDMITCGTWADIWLNEGFATYCEALWIEHQDGRSPYMDEINNDASAYFSDNPGWPIVNPEWAVTTPDDGTLFDYGITYAKGACVLHTLRYALGDSLFFAAMKAYATDLQFKYKNARTADFVIKVSQVAGQDMSWFFDEWLYQPNHPVYENYYSMRQAGTEEWHLTFGSRQVQTNTVFFTMPLEVEISFVDAPDTLIRIMNSSPSDQWTFVFSHEPTGLQFDPNNGIPLKRATTSIVTSLSEQKGTPAVFSLEPNYPNPFNPSTIIKYTVGGIRGQGLGVRDVSLIVYDVLGREVAILVNEPKAPGIYEVRFDGSGLSSGVYIYRLTAANFIESRKMVILK
jgi:aminopeptidase N